MFKLVFGVSTTQTFTAVNLILLFFHFQINIVTHNGRDFREVRKDRYIRDPDGRQKARYIDKLARKLFPLAFVVFNIIYWLSYTLI